MFNEINKEFHDLRRLTVFSINIHNPRSRHLIKGSVGTVMPVPARRSNALHVVRVYVRHMLLLVAPFNFFRHTCYAGDDENHAEENPCGDPGNDGVKREGI